MCYHPYNIISYACILLCRSPYEQQSQEETAASSNSAEPMTGCRHYLFSAGSTSPSEDMSRTSSPLPLATPTSNSTAMHPNYPSVPHSVARTGHRDSVGLLYPETFGKRNSDSCSNTHQPFITDSSSTAQHTCVDFSSNCWSGGALSGSDSGSVNGLPPPTGSSCDSVDVEYTQL